MRAPDQHRPPVVPQQQADLLAQVASEQGGAGEGGAVEAGFQQHAVGEAVVGWLGFGVDLDREVGIHRFRRLARVAAEEAVAQDGDAFVIQRADARHRRVRVDEAGEVPPGPFAQGGLFIGARLAHWGTLRDAAGRHRPPACCQPTIVRPA